MRFTSTLLLIVVLVGCQGKPTPAPVAKKGTVPLVNEPLPPELVALLEDRDYEAAIARIDAMIQKQPASGVLYSVRSSIHHRNGRHEAAIADLDVAIQKNESDARLYNNRGYVKLGLQMFRSAMADFDQATKLTPEYANPFNNRGLLHIARGEYASAIEQLDQALVLDPNYVDAYNNRGFAALQMRNVARALADLNMAIRLNPRYVNAYNNRGLLRAQVGDLDNAIVDFTEAMMIDPMNPKYYEHRREVYLRKGAIDLALADETRHDWLVILDDINSVIQKTPNDPFLHVDRARHYLTVHDQEMALKDLDRALQIDPNCFDALLDRGRLRFDRKDFAGALTDARQALKIEARQEASSLCGDAYLALEDYDKALECYAAARRIDASVAEAYYGKSQALEAAGKVAEAEAAMKLAVSLNPALVASDDDAPESKSKTVPDPGVDPQEVADLVNHGQDCIKDKNYTAALADAEKLLQMKALEEGYSLSGDVHLGLKNYDKAIECYTKARRIDAADAVMTQESGISQVSGKNPDSNGLTHAVGNSSDQASGLTAPGRRTAWVSKEAIDLVKKGRGFIEEGEYAKALEIAGQIQDVATIQEASSVRGDAYLGLKNYDKAIECYAKAHRIDAAVAEAYFRRSQTLEAAGQHEPASESLKHAIALDPEKVKQLQQLR